MTIPVTTELQAALQALELKQFFDQGQATFAEVMRWKDDHTLSSWASHLLDKLVPYVGGFKAALYYTDLQRQLLRFAGGYAIEPETLKQEISYGDGLIGQAAKSQEIVHLPGLDESYFSLSLPDMWIRPDTLLILPLIYNRRTWGVIEIFFLHPIQPQHLGLLEKLSTDIGANLTALIKEKELVESEERFRKLAEVTLEGIAFTNGFLITETNSVFLEMFDIRSREVTGKSLTEFTTPECRTDVEEKLNSNFAKPFEALGLTGGGMIFPVEIQSRHITYNGECLQVTTFRDITEQKEAERELRESEAQLAEAQKVVKLMEIIETKNKNITASINYARKIQHAILPDMRSVEEAFQQAFVFYRCRDVVSGDFYWFSKHENDVFIAAVDCTGHGVPGAFMSLIGYSQLNRIVNELHITRPGAVLSKLDESIVSALRQREDPTSQEGMDIAFCRINTSAGRLEFAGANRPLILIRNQEITVIEGLKMPIGGSFYQRYNKVFTNHEIDIVPGDVVYIFSDGYADQFSPAGKKYMIRRLKSFLLSIHHFDMQEQKRLLQQEFENWKGNSQQIDDVLMIGMKF